MQNVVAKQKSKLQSILTVYFENRIELRKKVSMNLLCQARTAEGIEELWTRKQLCKIVLTEEERCPTVSLQSRSVGRR